MLVKPTSLDDELLTEISDVSDRSAKAGDAELAKSEQHFERRTGSTMLLNSFCGQRHCPLILPPE
jgi:hypothetical protein